MEKIQKKSYAKINLGLEVLNKRHDGFHNINTIFTRISLHDDITIKRSDKISVRMNPDLGLKQEDNLVYKTFILFKNIFNIDSGIEITINKNIPSGGGLGGGSSNAASVLLGLCELFNIDRKSTEIFNIAKEIGSDVPFFLEEGTAIAKGRGEILQYFDYKLHYYTLLVFPGIHISTPWAYKALNRDCDELKTKNFKEILLKSIEKPDILKDEIINDFESVCFREYPALRDIKEKLYQCDALLALMSGSGSTMFGLFSSIESAIKAQSEFQQYNTFISNPTK